MILKRMKRRHSREEAIAFCTDMRKARPDIIYGADIIAGFPTETEEMFQNSLDLVTDCGLTWLHVFPYSPREGTPAARIPQLDRSIIKQRAARLRAVGEKQVAAHLSAQLGKVHNVLMENSRMGRTEGFTEVLFDSDQPVGQIVQSRIHGTTEGKLLGSSPQAACHIA